MSSDEATDRAETVFYKWTCPICEHAIGNRAADTSAAIDQAARALRVHIKMSNDEGHGPRYKFPPTVDPAMLDDYVTVRDRR